MTLMKWKPFNRMERIFDEDFSLSPLTLPKLGWDLAVDVYEKNGNVIAEMALPGIDPDKVDISVEDDYLRVAGSREEEKETQENSYYSKEIKRGSFERVVHLPTSVQDDKAEAEYKDGVLKIKLPKKEKAKGKVIIKVKK